MNAPSIPNPKNSTNNPVYLLVTNSLSGEKGVDRFLVTTLEEQAAFVKIKGIKIQGSSDLYEDNAGLVRHLLTLDKSSYVQVTIPWHRVLSIKNLIYKHKEA